jgi:amino acid adenylation domain-containing protein
MAFQHKLISSLRDHAANIAIESNSITLSYADLQAASGRVSGYLIEKNVKPDDVVAIYLDKRIEIIPAMIGVMNARAQFVLVDPSLPAKRIELMLGQVEPLLIISSKRGPDIKAIIEDMPVCFFEDLLSRPMATDISYPDYNDNDSLYVYFTSGTTGVPKGIIGSNCGLSQFIDWEIQTFKITTGMKISQLISPYFDAFLRDIFVPLLSGATICIPPQNEDFFTPQNLTAWIDQSRISLIHCVPSVFRIINEAIDSGLFVDMRFVLMSGERIIPSELTNWYKVFGPRIQLVNLYGCTETTMIRAYYLIKPDDARLARIPVGFPIWDTELLVAGKDMKACETIVPGDLYIISEYITKGYLAAPELTKERFITIPDKSGKDRRAFKTGDKARVMPGGEIELIGREDRQVKMRGIRIELDEIESAIMKSGRVRGANVILSQDDRKNEKLISFVTGKDGADRVVIVKELQEHLAVVLPKYMLPSDIVVIDEFPLLSNGKINYDALNRLLVTERKVIEPVDDLERKIMGIWKSILGDKSISTDDSFHRIGGNSLTIMNLIGKISRDFNVRISLSELFKNSTIQKQAAFVRNATANNGMVILSAPRKDYYRLLSSQKRLYFLYEFEKSSLAYNLPQVVTLKGKLDRNKMTAAFNKLISRHECLRSYFKVINDEPAQIVVDKIEFEPEYIVSERTEVHSIIRRLIRPFDLGKAPLMRVALIQVAQEEHVIFVDKHHIITDGQSQVILLKDFMTLYSDGPMPELKVTFKDFAEWQYSDAQVKRVSVQRDFWMKEFSEEVQTLELPYDFARPLVKRYEGNIVKFVIDQEQTSALNSIAQKEGATMFMVMLSIFNIFLSKLGNQEDIVVCTPIAGRQHPELEHLVGMFASTLPLRNDAAQALTFHEFLQNVRTKTLACFDNMDFPYEELIDALHIERDTSRNPLFDVMLVYNNFKRIDLEIPGLSLEFLEPEHSVSKFDLTLSALEIDDAIEMSVEYATGLFKPETINRFIGYIRMIISSVIADVNKTLADIEILSEQERERLLSGFTTPAPKRNIPSLFTRIASERGNEVAVVCHGESMTYRQLNERSNQLARKLMALGRGREDRIGILMARSNSLIVSIFGVLKAGCAYVPIDPEYPVDRIAYIAKDSSLSILIADPDVSQAVLEQLPSNVQIVKLADDDLSSAERSDVYADISPAQLAYVIYTSGSTGKPKGVMIEHGNVLNFVEGVTGVVPLRRTNVMLCQASIAFDMSVGETLLPLLTGMKVVLSTGSEQKDPVANARLIAEHDVDVLHITPSLLKLILSADVDAKGVILSRLKTLMVGAEPFPVDLLRGIRKVYSGNLFNMYGPTETTVWSTIQDLTNAPSINIGKPIANTIVRIMDSNQKLLPIGVAGELCIGGEGVARGYWNNEKLTQEKFIIDPILKTGRLYRTGDQARWLPDGNIEFIGRIDNQVKIRGYRIELGEIEQQLVKHERIREVAVVAKEKDDEKVLVAYYVSDTLIESAELRTLVSAHLPGYMVPAFFVHLTSLPRNPNGKLDRKALPEPQVPLVTAHRTTSSLVENKLVEIWSAVLKVDQQAISVQSNFFDLGGHSLKAIVLASKVSQEFGVKVSLKTIFQFNTIRALAGAIEGGSRRRFAPIPVASKQKDYPLSDTQANMFFLATFEPLTLNYNMPRVIRIDGKINRDALLNSFRRLIDRHEVFRTSFSLIDGVPFQSVADSVEFELEHYVCMPNEVRATIEKFVRPFDLSSAPLIRATTVATGQSTCYLVVDTHHIVMDGISEILFAKELADLYMNKEVSQPRLQYKDYAVWQQSDERQQVLETQKGFWVNLFADGVQVLDLPVDHTDTDELPMKGGATDLSLTEEESDKLRTIAKRQSTTVFNVILSIYNILLGKIANQEDVMVGTQVAGREHGDVENMIGMFVAVLPLRNYPKGEARFDAFLDDVTSTTLAAFENEAYQYKAPVHEFGIRRTRTGHASLFNAFYIYQNIATSATIDIPGLSFEGFDTNGMVELRYPVTLIVNESKGRINLRLCTNSLFNDSSRERFAACLAKIIKTVTDDTQILISDISILQHSEKKRILESFNKPASPVKIGNCFIEIFDKQVRKRSSHIAVSYNEDSLTYRELSDQSSRLSFMLEAEGVSPGSRVAILMPRGIQMAASILAIFRCGCAYVPIDVEYPVERIREIITDSEVALVLTSNDANFKIDPAAGVKVIDLKRLQVSSFPKLKRKHKASGDDLAYMIYTSGTTGKPKGVMVHQAGMMNHLDAKISYLGLNDDDTVAQTASPCFDISVWQFLAALASGGKTRIIDKDIQLNPHELAAEFRDSGVTVFESVPSLVANFLDGLPPGGTSLGKLRWMILTGERSAFSLVQKWKSVFPAIALLNAYGPTEASDDITHYTVNLPADEQPLVPVGKPIANTHIYILDKYSKLCPVGIKGEICVAGAGVGKGYWKNPRLTSEKFVTNPFSDEVRDPVFATMFRTGDIGYFLPDGNIICMGRIDDQLKIRGFRIEPEEIENVLLANAKVKDAVVISHHHNGRSDKRLGAFVVGNEIHVPDLKRYMKEKLPDYMVPSDIIKIEKMPLTTNGKIDRKALLNKLAAVDLARENYVVPDTPLERSLVAIWQDLLGLEKVGIEDNFFELGGHSLLAMKLAASIKTRLQIDVPIKIIFQLNTIALLAKWVETTNIGSLAVSDGLEEMML